jgi:DNA-binding NarL/FixJ family response regulator
VLVLLADGLTTGQVASALLVSEHTVRSRVRSTLGKLGARNREHAIAIAFREGVL